MSSLRSEHTIDKQSALDKLKMDHSTEIKKLEEEHERTL